MKWLASQLDGTEIEAFRTIILESIANIERQATGRREVWLNHFSKKNSFASSAVVTEPRVLFCKFSHLAPVKQESK